MTTKNCEKCGKEDKLRRGMCLNCYREKTGLSRGSNSQYSLRNLIRELEKAEQRVRMIKSKMRVILK